MSKGKYLCADRPGHESCATHNEALERKQIVDRLMAPLYAFVAGMKKRLHS